MKMIVGLGNIGTEYEDTRHNIGFMVVDAFAKAHNAEFNKEKFHGFLAETFIDGEKVILVKPATYMNESGRAVGPLVDYFDLDLADLIIISDDLDLEVGKVRLRQKGSAGGHNGLKSIIAHLHTTEFNRLKIGIGRPKMMSVVNWVLGDFSQAEKAKIDLGIDLSVEILEKWTKGASFVQLMNEYN